MIGNALVLPVQELESAHLRCEGRCSARHVRVPQEEILRFEYHAMTLSDFEVEPEKKKDSSATCLLRVTAPILCQ